MAQKWTDEQQKFLSKNFTIEGRMLFPNLFTARAKEAGKRETFDGQFAWNPQLNPKNLQVTQEIFQYLAQACAMFHQGLNPAALVNPVKDFNTYQRQDARPNAEYLRGLLWVNASTGKEFPPQVVKSSPMGAIKLTAQDEAEAYSGRNVVFNISFYPMIPQPGSANQKRGFSVNINAVLLLDGGERIGGGTAVDTNQVFSSFVQDMGATPSFGGFGQAAPPAAPAAPGFPGGQPAAPPAAPAWGQPPAAPQAPATPPWGAPPPAPAAPAATPPWGAPPTAPAAPAWGQPPAAPQAPAAPGFPGGFNNNFGPGYGQ